LPPLQAWQAWLLQLHCSVAMLSVLSFDANHVHSHCRQTLPKFGSSTSALHLQVAVHGHNVRHNGPDDGMHVQQSIIPCMMRKSMPDNGSCNEKQPWLKFTTCKYPAQLIKT
jgi:hypothetical protein